MNLIKLLKQGVTRLFHGALLAIMVLIQLMTVSCGENIEKPRNESFINIYEADRQGEKRYFSRELNLYPDGTAIITNNGNLILCKVEERTDSTAVLSGVAVYADADLTEASGVTVPSRFSVSWKGSGGVNVTTPDRSFKNFKNAVYRYNPRITYYSPCHVLHENYLKTQAVTADSRQLASADKAPETLSQPNPSLAGQTADEPQPVSSVSSKNKNLSATGVPIKPDYSSGRNEGTINDFQPKNLLQFIDYYFGIIVFIFFLCELALLWYGKVADDLEDYSYGYRNSLGFYTILCFSLLLVESVTEIMIFTANPMVLFESDMPLFGCLGRAFFFFAACIGQSSLIRIMRWKLHLFYGVSFIKFSWLLTSLAVGLVVLAAMSLFGTSVSTEFSKTAGISLFAVAVIGIWLLSVIRLVRFIIISHKTPLAVILFYLLIYPLFVPVSACAIALGLLGKIAAEKPDNEYEKIDDSDNHRYVTDALGNSAYLTNLGNGHWMDSEGNYFQQHGNSFSNTSNGRPYW